MFRRRPAAARFEATPTQVVAPPSSAALPCAPQPPQQLHKPSQPVPLSLSTYELHSILRRRVVLHNLPDDAHTHVSESFSYAITLTSAFMFKLYLLDHAPLYTLPKQNPRLARILTILTLSQLPPLHLLWFPFIRFIRPLQWLLVPFRQMALPLSVNLLARFIIRRFTPSVPTSTKVLKDIQTKWNNWTESVGKSVSSGLKEIQNKIDEVAEAVENHRTQGQLHPPQFPTLQELLPPFPGMEQHDDSPETEESLSDENESIIVSRDVRGNSPFARALSNRQRLRGLGSLDSIAVNNGFVSRVGTPAKDELKCEIIRNDDERLS